MNLDELVVEIKTSPVSLFYGAGVTIACGGPKLASFHRDGREPLAGGESGAMPRPYPEQGIAEAKSSIKIEARSMYLP